MKKGQEYEKLSHEVVGALNYGKRATYDARIVGKLTEVERQIDVKLDESDFDFVMYECKDWSKSIGVGVVGQLVTDLEDVGARRGAIISNSPFTKGAKNLARKKGISLLHLVKTDSPKPKMGISVLTLVRVKVIDTVRLAIEGIPFDALMRSLHLDEFIIIHRQQQMTLREYVRERWNEGLNADGKVGENILELNDARIIDAKGSEHTAARLIITLTLKELFYQGPWLVEEARGLYNALDNTFHAYGNMKSAKLKVKEIEKSFIELDPKDVNQDKYSIILDVASEYH